MSTRLVARLALAAPDDRAPDSQDILRFQEPAVGAPARTKGSLYLLAEVGGGPAVTRAATQALDAIEHDYYYDLSAGPLGALARALESANRRLYHERQRLGIGRGGAIGVVACAVRDRELHVASIGTAAAAILRDDRMFELPPPREEGDFAPGRPQRRRAASLGEALAIVAEAWEGELAAGDRIALISRHLASVVGAEAIRAALAAGAPSAAVAGVAEAFRTAGGSGSDGLLVLEIVAVPSTTTTRQLEPVWPDDRLAGLPDRGPLPVADTVGGAFRRADHAIDHAQSRLGRQWRYGIGRLAAHMPHRRVAYPGEVVRTEAVDDRRRRRRALLGMVGLSVVVSAGLLVASLPAVSPTEAIPRLIIAREAVATAQDLLAAVDERVDGQDLLERDPARAQDLLANATVALERAADAGVAADELAPLRSRVDSRLDSLFAVARVREFSTVVDLATAYDGFRAGRMVGATDGSLWIIDSGRGRVIRVDPATGVSEVVLRPGTEVDGATPADPWLMATAATDVVVIDRERQAWRMDLVERIPRRMTLNDVETVDSESRLLAALQHRPPLEIFNLYLVDAGDSQIRKWTPPASIPVNFPDPWEPFLAEEPDLDPARARDLVVDVNVWLLQARTMTRVNFGTPLTQSDYSLDPPPDAAVRGSLDYQLLDALTRGDHDEFLVYDRGNARIIAFARANGAFVRQWLAPASGAAAGLLDGVVGMVAPSVVDGPAVAYLLIADRVVRVVLE
jgi:hypothetical protein